MNGIELQYVEIYVELYCSSTRGDCNMINMLLFLSLFNVNLVCFSVFLQQENTRKQTSQKWTIHSVIFRHFYLTHDYFKAANFVIRQSSRPLICMVRVKSDCALHIRIDENG